MIELCSAFNLSDFEYLTYLDCPFKFYLIKDNSKRNNQEFSEIIDFADSRVLFQENVLWLQWFKTFHKIYENCIMIGDRPLKNSNTNKVAEYFYEFELERFKQYPKNWFPLVQDVFIQNDYYRGTIDRVDQMNEQGDCRIILYKTGQERYIQQEMLFNAVLLSHEKENLQWFPKEGTIKEICLYLYPKGEFIKQPITEKEILFYESRLYLSIKEMLKPNLKKKKECNFYTTNCPFREICKRIQL